MIAIKKIDFKTYAKPVYANIDILFYSIKNHTVVHAMTHCKETAAYAAVKNGTANCLVLLDVLLDDIKIKKIQKLLNKKEKQWGLTKLTTISKIEEWAKAIYLESSSILCKSSVMYIIWLTFVRKIIVQTLNIEFYGNETNDDWHLEYCNKLIKLINKNGISKVFDSRKYKTSDIGPVSLMWYIRHKKALDKHKENYDGTMWWNDYYGHEDYLDDYDYRVLDDPIEHIQGTEKIYKTVVLQKRYAKIIKALS